MAATILTLALAVSACGTRVDQATYEQALAEEALASSRAATPGSDPGDLGPGVTAPATAGAAADGHGAPATPGTTAGVSDADAALPGQAQGTSPQDPAAQDAGLAASSPSPAAAPDAPGDDRPPTGADPAVLARLSDEVVGDTIKVGLHVPITGAAPMPTDWTKYLDVVVQYLNEDLPPHGRRIEFVIQDDGYDAAKAMAACRQLADGDPLFVIGHTMPAAEDACAGFLDTKNIPYLMRGTFPEVLDDRPLAFFGTTPDDVQGRLLADYVLANLGGATTPIGVLFQNDQVSAKNEFVARLADAGVEVAVIEEGTPRQADYSATIQKFRAADVGLAFVSAPPVDAIKIAVQSQQQGYHPTWLGGGSYWNYNMVIESAGMAIDGAVSFSPWPTIDSPAADEFKAVYRRYRPSEEAEDIGLILWGWARLVHTAVQDAGPDLSRRSFYEALLQLEFDQPYWNPISYADHGRWGADSVAVFRADGQSKRWRQIAAFSSAFS